MRKVLMILLVWYMEELLEGYILQVMPDWLIPSPS